MTKAKLPGATTSDRQLNSSSESRNVRLTKLDRLIEALMAPGGAAVPTMMTITGWQSHSVRGALAGTLKKRKGLTIGSEKRDGVRYYRIEEALVR